MPLQILNLMFNTNSLPSLMRGTDYPVRQLTHIKKRVHNSKQQTIVQHCKPRNNTGRLTFRIFISIRNRNKNMYSVFNYENNHTKIFMQIKAFFTLQLGFLPPYCWWRLCQLNCLKYSLKHQ